MAISKVKLPNNTTQDIHDSRIAAIDAAPASGSTNVVTSGGVYTAIENAGGGIDSVVVTVGPNSGTPTGSATFSDGVLTLSFDNLKGANGAAGADGQSAIMQRIDYTSSDTSVTNLAWGTVHVFPEMSSLGFTLATAPSDGYEHRMTIIFDTPSDITNFTFTSPSNIYWGYNINLASNIAASSRYEITISSSSMIAYYGNTSIA